MFSVEAAGTSSEVLPSSTNPGSPRCPWPRAAAGRKLSGHMTGGAPPGGRSRGSFPPSGTPFAAVARESDSPAPRPLHWDGPRGCGFLAPWSGRSWRPARHRERPLDTAAAGATPAAPRPWQPLMSNFMSATCCCKTLAVWCKAETFATTSAERPAATAWATVKPSEPENFVARLRANRLGSGTSLWGPKDGRWDPSDPELGSRLS